jgi:predicted Zn finger-like uncharacterized protein
MLKVECESCKAPYQIDERRVPPAGLKMRCPKCGHTFVVASPGGSGVRDPAAAPRPGALAPSPKREPPRPPMPSDFPAALGSLDEPDLPVVSAELPAARRPTADLPAAKRPPPRPAPKDAPAAAAPTGSGLKPASFGDIDLDLPTVPADLPEARRSALKPPPLPVRSFADLPAPRAHLPAIKRQSDLDLPSVAADLPAIAASLPVVAAGLPSTTASLPSLATNLPSPAAGLPSPAAGLPVRSFGEIDLPTVAETLPVALPPGHNLPVRSQRSPEGLASFGEIELPGEPPVVPPSAASSARESASRASSADFGDLELDDKPRVRSRSSGAMQAVHDPNRGGGMTFGEVDFASSHEGATGEDASISVVAPPPRPDGTSPGRPGGGPMPNESPAGLRAMPGMEAAATAPVRTTARASLRETAASAPKRSIGRRVTLGVLAAAVLAGAALQLTPYGAYGYLWAADHLRAKEYERVTIATMGATEKALALDTYDQANAAVESAAAAHGRAPRDRSLTAYAAVVDCAAWVRFGPDTARASRAKELLAELPPDDPVKYLDVALAGQAAANDDLDKARKELERASKDNAGDPIEIEVALLRGGVELASMDGSAALVAFKRALELSNDARAHFGLARAYDVLGDAVNTRREIEATLAASTQHPGALTLRARMKSALTEETQALGDLATVLDGPVRAKAAPNELSRAYAARAWVSLERGSASEARDAFAQAVKLDPRNVAALTGEGHLLLSEGRYTEALARFDTALQIEPSSPDAIADDAEAKLALERLGDAKQQLAGARQAFPKSLAILVLLGQVEQHLGNDDAAEGDLRAAVAMVDPSRRDAVRPYVVLSELLSSRGRLAEAKAVLDEAKNRLTSSAALDRALGEVAELQGEHDIAIAHYQAAITKDPRDLAAHFRLAVTLRRIRRFEDAGAELDKVVAVDKDYPGLSLERGLLFEESGDVQKAILEFQGALARAPNDPDLQLRVGSAYVAIGRPDDAIPMLRKVLQERPRSADAQHYLGRALMLKGPSQQSEALNHLKQAVDLDSNRAEFHVYLAWAANEAEPRQLELARDEIVKALALDKFNAEIYWLRGVLEWMQGQIEDAIKDEKRALELRPTRYEAHATLAECYEQKNDEGPALSEWAKAVAGDGEATGPEGAVRHPYWRYKYGKLLTEHGQASAALPFLLPAATTMEKSEQHPAWLATLEFLTGETLRKAGRNAEALEHLQRFMAIAPVSSPDRADAQAAIRKLTSDR